MPKYHVELSTTYHAWHEVDADNEDDAIEVAVQAAESSLAKGGHKGWEVESVEDLGE